MENRNAWKHGFASGYKTRGIVGELKRLAQFLAEGSTDDAVLEAALNLAELQIIVRTIRLRRAEVHQQWMAGLSNTTENLKAGRQPWQADDAEFAAQKAFINAFNKTPRNDPNTARLFQEWYQILEEKVATDKIRRFERLAREKEAERRGEHLKVKLSRDSAAETFPELRMLATLEGYERRFLSRHRKALFALDLAFERCGHVRQRYPARQG